MQDGYSLLLTLLEVCDVTKLSKPDFRSGLVQCAWGKFLRVFCNGNSFVYLNEQCFSNIIWLFLFFNYMLANVNELILNYNKFIEPSKYKSKQK